MNPDRAKNQVSLTYFTGQNRLPKKVGVNRHFHSLWDVFTVLSSIRKRDYSGEML